MLTELAKMKHADSSSRPDLSLFQPLSCHIRLFRPELNQASAGQRSRGCPTVNPTSDMLLPLSEETFRDRWSINKRLWRKISAEKLFYAFELIVSSIIVLERRLNWPIFDTIMSYSSKPKALSVKQQPLLLCDGILQHCKITTVITFRVEICKI